MDTSMMGGSGHRAGRREWIGLAVIALPSLLTRRIRPAFVMVAGSTLAAVGFGLLTQVDVSSGLTILVIGSVLFTLGAAPVGTLATDAIVGSAPPEKAGAASGISETTAELGGALGIAVLGASARPSTAARWWAPYRKVPRPPPRSPLATL